MSSKLLTYCLVFFFSITNCVEPHEFKPEETNRYLVIDGRITQANEVNRIKLTLSTVYSTYSSARPIVNAEINLVNSKNESEYFIEEGEGFYAHYGNSVKIIVGETYHIEMTYGQKKYRSTPQTLPEPLIQDSISFKTGQESEVNNSGNLVTYENINIFVHTPINVQGENSYLRWKTKETWSFGEISCGPLHIPKTCYMTGKLNDDEIIIYSSDAITGNYLSNKLVAIKRILDRAEFIEKHIFSVYQYTITKEAYEYWEKAVQIANPSGDIFDLPPAQFSGNVYNVDDKDEIVLGYFEVAGKSISRIPLYKPDILPLTITSKSRLCRTRDYAYACCNCLVLKNSSTVRPAYW